jgi:hypothetical protein
MGGLVGEWAGVATCFCLLKQKVSDLAQGAV